MAQDVYYNGAWHTGLGHAFSNLSPSTGLAVWEGHAASPEQVQQAFDAAKEAQLAWALRPQSERNEILMHYASALDKRREEIAVAISKDMGKPLWESRTEANAMVGKVAISIKALDERAGERTADTAFGSTHLIHRPHGIMAVLGPFNFPGHLPNGHIVPALLAGNCCIFKPSEEAPSVAAIMVAAFEEAGLPKGCISVVHGGRETGQALLATGINGVLFTGSVETGLLFHKMFAGRPDVMLALELGGNNPLIVWEPCDVKNAANLIFQSAFFTSGQRCSCARRLILPDTDFADNVINELIRLIDQVRIGSWEQDDVFMGPLVSARAAQKALEFQSTLIAHGAKPIKLLEQLEQGDAFVSPGLIDVTDMKAHDDKELFGPFLQISRVPSFEAAIDVANQTKFGLAGGLICDDSKMWDSAHQQMKAGILNWNRPTTGASSALPFGGPGHSGNFRPGAYYAADYCAWPQASQLSRTAVAINMPGLSS